MTKTLITVYFNNGLKARFDPERLVILGGAKKGKAMAGMPIVVKKTRSLSTSRM